MLDFFNWYSSLTYSWFGAIDYIEAIFWCFAYLTIIYTAFFNRNERRFPISATTIFINLAWETASIVLYVIDYGLEINFNRASFIRYSWFILDIFIFILYYHKTKLSQNSKKTLYFYITFYLFLAIIFFLCFNHFEYGMPISAFIIDAHMEILYWKNRKELDPANRLTISIFKILGDFFAGMYYGRCHWFVFILAVVAFVFDVMYIVFAVKEKKSHPEIKEHFQKELSLFYKDIKNQLLPQNNNHPRRKYKKKNKNKKTHRKKR